MRITSSIAAIALCLSCDAAIAQNQFVERVPTGFVEDGNPVSLELVVFKPAGEGPFPTLVFNHGSVSNGNDPREVSHTVTYPALATFFNEHGWMVVFPQRRGRGQSGGRYAEGWDPDRGRYSCAPSTSLAGLEHALQDLDVVTTHLQRRTDVDLTRMLIGGHSKGGILSMALAAKWPDRYIGVINFVGGWVGERCETAEEINTRTFSRSATFPRATLWLYGEGDPIYRMAHSRKNFEAFLFAGGKGSFHALSLGPLRNGHQLVRSREAWQDTLATFVKALP